MVKRISYPGEIRIWQKSFTIAPVYKFLCRRNSTLCPAQTELPKKTEAEKYPKQPNAPGNRQPDQRLIASPPAGYPPFPLHVAFSESENNAAAVFPVRKNRGGHIVSSLSVSSRFIPFLWETGFRKNEAKRGRGGIQRVRFFPQKNSATVPGPVWLPIVVPTL